MASLIYVLLVSLTCISCLLAVLLNPLGFFPQFVVKPNSFLYLAQEFSVTRCMHPNSPSYIYDVMLIWVSVYANSFLAMMNARGSLRDTLSQPIDVEFNVGTLRFDGSVSRVGCTSPEGRKNSHSPVSDTCWSKVTYFNTRVWLSLDRCGITDISSFYGQSDRIYTISTASWNSGGWHMWSLTRDEDADCSWLLRDTWRNRLFEQCSNEFYRVNKPNNSIVQHSVWMQTLW